MVQEEIKLTAVTYQMHFSVSDIFEQCDWKQCKSDIVWGAKNLGQRSRIQSGFVQATQWLKCLISPYGNKKKFSQVWTHPMFLVEILFKFDKKFSVCDHAVEKLEFQRSGISRCEKTISPQVWIDWPLFFWSATVVNSKSQSSWDFTEN